MSARPQKKIVRKRRAPLTRMAQLRVDLGLTYAQLGEKLNVSGSQAERMCLPPDDPRFSRPGREASELLRQWTRQLPARQRLTIANFSDPAPGPARSSLACPRPPKLRRAP